MVENEINNMVKFCIKFALTFFFFSWHIFLRSLLYNVLLYLQDVAVVELNGSDSEWEEDEETSESDSDAAEITETNLKLPGDRGRKKANIQVVEQEGE